jgi:hypothetical protein
MDHHTRRHNAADTTAGDAKMMPIISPFRKLVHGGGGGGVGVGVAAGPNTCNLHNPTRPPIVPLQVSCQQ